MLRLLWFEGSINSLGFGLFHPYQQSLQFLAYTSTLLTFFVYRSFSVGRFGRREVLANGKCVRYILLQSIISLNRMEYLT